MRFYRLLLITAILLFICSFSHAQRMVKEGNQWSVYDPPFIVSNSSTEIYRIGGDTLVDNLLYHQVYTTRDTSGLNWRLSIDLLREDTTTKRVYWKAGSQDEFLLYDFSLEVGDTIPFQISFDFVCDVFVHSIDTVTLENGEQRRRLNLGDQSYGLYSGDYWIEGIGSNHGPFFYRYCATDQNFILLCHSDAEGILFSNSSEGCFIATSVSNILPPDIEVFPNPFTDEIQIKFEETSLSSIQILDIMGRQVLEEKDVYNVINTSMLESGTYILLLQTTEGRTFSQKLIKSN